MEGTAQDVSDMILKVKVIATSIPDGMVGAEGIKAILEIEVININTHGNLADALTKHVDGDTLHMHTHSTSQRTTQGRHELMPEVAQHA